MKLININIEGDKHFDRVIPFIERELPDVLCLQEVFKGDLIRFSDAGYFSHFLPITRKESSSTYSDELGIALLVKEISASVSHEDTMSSTTSSRNTTLMRYQYRTHQASTQLFTAMAKIQTSRYSLPTLWSTISLFNPRIQQQTFTLNLV